MDTPTAIASWVPTDACTLPSEDRPFRLAELDRLFVDSLQSVARVSSTWLRLDLTGPASSERRVRGLAAREQECCGFFDFSVVASHGGVTLDVRVPDRWTGVLDGIEEQAAAVLGARIV
jgi:hypothetical protein